MASIRKVKFKPGLVEIQTVASFGKQEQETVTKSAEDPHPDFNNAFADLAKSVYDILQLPRDWMAGRLKVTAVSFSESDAGVRGAVITGQITLDTADAPFNFNTPHLPFKPYSPTGGGKVMPDSAVERLEKVLEEAASFLTGKRTQLELLDKTHEPA
jgi:hypothetical protein